MGFQDLGRRVAIVDKKYPSLPDYTYHSQSDIVTLRDNWEKNTNLPCILRKLLFRAALTRVFEQVLLWFYLESTLIPTKIQNKTKPDINAIQ